MGSDLRGSPAAGTLRDPADGRGPWRGAGAVLVIWLGSRILLVLVMLASAVLGGIRLRWWNDVPGQLLFAWDSNFFYRIALHGYDWPGNPCCDEAFFPGYPLAMRAVAPLVGGDVINAGIVISLVAGSVAAVLLWRLGTDEGGPRRGLVALLFLTTAPYGLFLSAVYSEALFLALSLAAWWAGSRGRWWWAGALAAAAAGVRVNGLFLVAGLAVMYALQLRAERRRPGPEAAALLLPAAVVAAFVGYLYAITGSWAAWQEAQVRGWRREVAWPWDAMPLAWQEAVEATSVQVAVSRWSDLLAVLVGLVVVGVLLRLRRYPEATYLLFSVAVLVCSTRITSAARYAVVWFPVYLLLAQLAERSGWRWLRFGGPMLGSLLLGVLAFWFATRTWVN